MKHAMQLDARRKRYFRLSTQLARASDNVLLSQLRTLPHNDGWGRNQVMDVEGERVFVKRIPVTDREMRNARSTRNLHQLPLYYNYGVGSAGFGAFRELLTHVKTTNWVLDGAAENFPLTYHQRIVPYTGKARARPEEQLERYVRYWNGSKRVGRYIDDRDHAGFEAIVFLEHIPQPLGSWLAKHEEKIPHALEEMRRTVAFLRANDVIHFDAHAGNMMTDGERTYLGDYGLVLDLDFELNEKERRFFREHSHYDDAELAINLAYHLDGRLRSLSPSKRTAILERYDLASEHPRKARALVDRIEDLATTGLIVLDPGYVDVVVRYRPIIHLMDDFFHDMHAGNRKSFHFDNARLKRLLKQVDR